MKGVDDLIRWRDSRVPNWHGEKLALQVESAIRDTKPEEIPGDLRRAHRRFMTMGTEKRVERIRRVLETDRDPKPYGEG